MASHDMVVDGSSSHSSLVLGFRVKFNARAKALIRVNVVYNVSHRRARVWPSGYLAYCAREQWQLSYKGKA